MTLDQSIEKNILKQNNAKNDDFVGLSPNQIHILLYDTFSEYSPLKIREDLTESTLDQIPLFKIAEEYLKIIQRDQFIKLTPLGALPKKILIELYDKKFLLDEFIESGIVKLNHEEKAIPIRSARIAIELAGLVRKTKGKLFLTKAALKLLETNNRLEIFRKFFESFTNKFLWSYNDRYQENYIGQIGWGFSVILLNKFGEEWAPVKKYSEAYLRAFPTLISFLNDDYLISVEKMFLNCYTIRTFNRFFIWFGFVEIDKKNKLIDLENNTYKRTDLLKRIFICP